LGQLGIYKKRSFILERRIDHECSSSDPAVLSRYRFAKMMPIVIKARDGVDLPCYLTLPPGIPPKNLPLILSPHGGPWARDEWGWNIENQILAKYLGGRAEPWKEIKGSTATLK
jgi:dipeptidyl aminopeptidase/acylaminoacyl peptidase